MGLVYVVADEQCVLVFGCSRHTDSSYRFGFLPVGPSAPSPVVYNTVRGTVEAAAPRPARVGHGARIERRVEYDDAVSRFRYQTTFHELGASTRYDSRARSDVVPPIERVKKESDCR